MKALAGISIAAANLKTLDSDKAADLVSVLFEDERPLRGIPGLADWRLCGMISRFLQQGHLTGMLGERALVPGLGRIPAQRLFLFGGGPRAGYAQSLPQIVDAIPQVLKAAGSTSVALALPGPSRVLAPEASRLVQNMSGHIKVVYDADGRLREWLDRDDDS